MSNKHDIPPNFPDADLFNKRVEELMQEYKRMHPDRSDAWLRELAESMLASDFFEA